MGSIPLSAPLYALKRQARLRARQHGMPLHEALDDIARENGFAQWSLLMARHASPDALTQLSRQLRPGQLLLLAARPLQGKTRLGFALMARALRAGQHAAFFSLDCTPAQVRTMAAAADTDGALWGTRFRWDCSDDVCAAHVAAQLHDAPPATVVVIDYLQLLDQRRDLPPVMQQMQVLRNLARERQFTVVVIAQIQRRFDEARRGMPGWSDVRLPNPLDASLFDHRCFVHQGQIAIQ